MDELDKIWIITLINGYMAGLIKEGCPQAVIQHIQGIKEKLIKILDEQ